MENKKVFCVGFQKTGTTSLGMALELLGYRVCGYHPFRDLTKEPVEGMDEKILSRARQLLPEHDVFKDSPWPLLYEMCDRECPGSKFIHVTRDDDAWIRSVVRDFGDYPSTIRSWIYGPGAPVGNEGTYLERYRRHNDEVRTYFEGREDQFISLHLDRGEVTWSNICSFLQRPVPDLPWPHANTAASKRRLKLRTRVLSRVRRLFGGHD